MDRNTNALWLSVYGKNALRKLFFYPHISQFLLFIPENSKISPVFRSFPFSIFNWANYKSFPLHCNVFLKKVSIQSCLNSIQPFTLELWDRNALKLINPKYDRKTCYRKFYALLGAPDKLKKNQILIFTQCFLYLLWIVLGIN